LKAVSILSREQAYLMNIILRATWLPDTQVWYGAALAVGLFCLNMVNAMLFVAPFSIMQIGGSRARNGCLGLLYQKLIHSQKVPDNSIGKVRLP
jgi:hypothetical protein